MNARHHFIISAFCFLLLLCNSSAQVLSPRAASQQPAAVPKFSLNLPALVVPAPQLLRWYSLDPAVVEWRVYAGPSRDNWTTNFIVSVREVQMIPGLHYGVASLAYGDESLPAYWPSNRVVALDVEVTDTLRNRFVGTFTWLTWTNAPDGPPSKYLRLKERLIRWE